MATLAQASFKQRKLARKIIEVTNKGETPTKEALLKSAGYSDTTAQGHGKEIIESEGVQIMLNEYGFTEENAKKVVASILNSPTVYEMVTPENQLSAAREVFKVKGSYAPTESKSLQVNVDLDILANSDLDAIRKEYEEKLKAKLKAKLSDAIK